MTKTFPKINFLTNEAIKMKRALIGTKPFENPFRRDVNIISKLTKLSTNFSTP